MYAIVRHYRAHPDTIRKMVEHVDAQFADRVPKQVGSVLYSAVGTGEGTVMTITVFHDAEAAAASEAAVTELQRNLKDGFGVEEFAVQRGEVLISRGDVAVTRPIGFGGAAA
ncbi:hypothetical protein [Nonomuraea sp. B1E8]|uniref:hypothetical protein n=1 Tax=unclassified Nonomuraea TaxID=2593643 RepID=UPI00325F195E